MSTVVASTQTQSAVSFNAWRETFAVDVRALALLRMGVAVILLFDLFYRSGDLTAHYTDAGVLPRTARMTLQWDFCEPWWMSLHMLNGSWTWNAALFLIAAIAAMALLVGYRTKLALLVSWILLLSLHGRFPMLLQGGDALLRCLLFWMLFLPLDARLSWQRTSDDPTRGSIISFGTVAILAQLLMMYLFTAFLKTAPSWTSNFHATYYALHIDHFTKPFGYALLAYPRLLQLLTASALLLEFIGPLLLLLPMGQRYWRTILPCCFIAFHVGLIACLDLGTFPWICILSWLLFLPTNVWERFDQVLTRLFAAHFRERSPATISTHGSLLLNAIAAFLLAYVVLMNVERLRNPAATVGRFPLNMLGKVTGLEQYWNMFSPGPYEYGSWLRVEGVQADGSLVNLYQPQEPLADTKPQNVSASYPTQYWRRCLVTAYEFEEPAQQTALLNYFAKRWNQSHPAQEQITSARLVHMVQPTPAPFSPAITSAERRVLQTWSVD